jgi:pimeloyl-[acyl-carrier protein] methyl ester esterase
MPQIKLGQGVPLVLLHGWGFSSQVMLALADSLAQHFAVSLVDLPGFGDHSWGNEAYNLENVSAKLAEQIPDNAIIVGWSLGGLLAIALANKINHCQGLVLIASSPCFVAKTAWPGIERKQLQAFVELLQTTKTTTVLQRFVLLQKSEKAVLRLLLQAIAKQSPPSFQGLMGGLQILLETDLRNTCLQLSIPILCLLAKQDQLLPRALTESLSNLLPSAIVQNINGCHASFLFNPTEVAQQIKDRYVKSAE